jgi:hypothetical protein
MIESTAPNCESLRRTLIVFQSRDDIGIKNEMNKKMERRPEGIFFGFPFNVPGGKWRVDTPWAMVEVEKDQLPGANRNYYCVQRFCNYSNDEFGIDWGTDSVPMMQFAPIDLMPALDITAWRDHIQPTGTIYSWVCNNHWETNYKAGQEGKMTFDYSIRPYIGKYDAAKSQKWANPVVNLNHETSKLLKLDNDNVVITRLKPCRELGEKRNSPYGQGLLVRLYNPTAQPQRVSLDFQTKGSKYRRVNLYASNPLEDRLHRIRPQMTIAPFDFITLRAE